MADMRWCADCGALTAHRHYESDCIRELRQRLDQQAAALVKLCEDIAKLEKVKEPAHDTTTT